MSFTDEEKRGMTERLGEILRFRTVSYSKDGSFPEQEFLGLREYLLKAYPAVASAMEREVIDGFTLLFKWKGREEGKPSMFMAHQDVVPAEEEGWEHPPFSGYDDGVCLWGRGAIDMKCQLAALLESCERLIAAGFVPQNDIYLLFTHNEEAPNETGAQQTAKLFAERGVSLRMILDEGGYAFSGKRYGMKEDGIHVSLCEKGYGDIEIIGRDPGGHASTPSTPSAMGRVCRAIAFLEAHQPKPLWNSANKALMQALAPHVPARMRSFEAFSEEPNKNALIRTTVAPTMLSGSLAPNVLPHEVIANLNVRLLPGDSIDNVMKLCKRAEELFGVKAELVKFTEPTPVADDKSAAFGAIKAALNRVYPQLVVVPSIMTGATDSRFFAAMAENVYRLSPFDCTMRLLDTMHGRNERIEKDSYFKGVAFFEALIGNF